MMLGHSSLRYLIWPVTLLGLGCGGGDVQAPPTTGTLTITTVTTGTTPDPDGYTLKIDSDPVEVVTANATLQRTEINAGNHTVEIGGIAANCTLSGDRLRTVAVRAGETTPVGFGVTCGPLAKIAFERLLSDDGIYLMNPDGTEVTRLTTTPIYSALHWSADRSRIVFDGGGTKDIYVINADGTGERQLTNTVPEQQRGRRINEEQFPTISPDGSRIAFEADQVPLSEFSNPEIYVVNTDGSGLTNVSHNPEGDYRPVWSPDGSRIAYVGAGRLWVMNPDGSDQAQISGDGQVELEAPTWSPDGRMLAFLVVLGGIAHPHTDYELHVVSLDGRGERSIATGNILIDPVWSPDGSRIAYGQDFQMVVVINPDGSNRRQLTGADLRRTSPVWSPDGARLAYTVEYPPTSASGGYDYEIGVMDVASGAETIVTQSPGWDFRQAWAP
jgi:Tol biopolymer transport system component